MGLTGKEIANSYKSLLNPKAKRRMAEIDKEMDYIYRGYRENIIEFVKNELNVLNQYWLNLKVKDEDGETIKFKTSMQKDKIVLKIYNGKTQNYKTNDGVWAYLTKKQAKLLIRELLFYIGADRKH